MKEKGRKKEKKKERNREKVRKKDNETIPLLQQSVCLGIEEDAFGLLQQYNTVYEQHSTDHRPTIEAHNNKHEDTHVYLYI